MAIKYYSGIDLGGDLIPSSDSTHDIGSNSVRFANIYADTLYGDGSNIINLDADNTVVSTSNFSGVLSSSDNNVQTALETLDGITKSDIGLGNVANTTITVTSSSVSDGTNTFNKYTLPSDVVQDSDYVHIDVTSTSVTDGTNTFNKYTLPTATASVLGGVKIGSGISISSGVISADDQTSGLATLADPTFTGTPEAPTAASGTNTTQIATTAFVQTAVSDLVDSSPAALDTLNELAAALGDDANFSTTVNTALGNRLRIDTASQGLNATQKSNGRTNLGLGTASTSASTDFISATSDDTTTGNITISKDAPVLKLHDPNTSTTNHATIRFTENNNQGVKLVHNEFDNELPIGGYGLILTGDDDNTQFPGTGTLSFVVHGNIYAGATTNSTVSRVLTTADEGTGNGLDADLLDGEHKGYFTNASNISSGTLSASRLPQTISGLDVLTADKIKGELKTVTLDAQYEVPVDLNTYTNIYCDIGITGWRGFDLTTLTATAVGNSGTIILHNGGASDMTLGTPFAFPTEFKTPNGDSIVWARQAGSTAILSYFVASTSIVLVNYIGNFQ